VTDAALCLRFSQTWTLTLPFATESGTPNFGTEVPLAELYLKGDGVPKNCEQAAVLLRAASKNGNVEALAKLKKLTKNGGR
jgi:TPR repeat protein